MIESEKSRKSKKAESTVPAVGNTAVYAGSDSLKCATMAKTAKFLVSSFLSYSLFLSSLTTFVCRPRPR